MLTEKLWCLLDSLADGPQSFEQVYADYTARWPGATREDLHADLTYLQTIGLASVNEFSAPAAEAQGAPSPAEPPGAEIEMTPRGEMEWDDAAYEPYWQEAAPPPKPFKFPPRLQYSLAGLFLLLAAVAVWGFMQATWSIASDKAVNLGSCVTPIRATLAAAGAPAEVLAQLDQAGRAGIWRSEAAAKLQAVNAALDSMRTVSGVAGAQADVERLMDSCRPDAPCQCSALGR